MKRFLLVAAVATLFVDPCRGASPQGLGSGSEGPKDRAETVGYLRRIADPVLENLAHGKLKEKLPQESSKRQVFAPLEAFGRTMAGIAPWLELGPDASDEGQLRARYINLAREAIRNAVDPNSPDHMTFAPNDQPVVDAAFLALGLLRAPHQLWDGLDPKVQADMISALKMTRSTKIGDNNWQCFTAVTEAAIWKFTGECDMTAIERAVSKHQTWYLGDGVYGDGPPFHWDYYNSYVIHPMLLQILAVCREKGNPLGDLYPKFLRRAQRYSQELERLISPEATFPVMGRSSTYRFGAFQDLSLMALQHGLPENLKPGGVRSALTSLIRRMLAQPGTFDQEGWLQPGAVGCQPQLREVYISRGSPYLCATGLLQLGLPAGDPFWTDPSSPWTQQRIWSGDTEVPGDHALEEKDPVRGPALSQASVMTSSSSPASIATNTVPELKILPVTITPASVIDIMEKVADWQMAHPSTDKPFEWTQAAGYTGFMALAGISPDPKYREAMRAMGEANQWQLGSRPYNADDHCVGQTYADLYMLIGEPSMIAPLRERFDFILSHPPASDSLDFKVQGHEQNWSWCDSLFMGPSAWLRLYRATGDQRYLDYSISNWWRTTDYLYDKAEHLYYRDSTYFNKREANGKKVFWGRGNGWVMAGLVRMLQLLPDNNPAYPRFVNLFKEMSARILSCQQSDGLWRASLLDPTSYPLQEVSGSGFYTYALTWGVNQGILDRATYEPAIRKAWTALVSCVEPDGKLTHIQPGGADPRHFPSDSSQVFGVGAFLLAGSEIFRMAVLEKAHPITVKVGNPADFWRENETVELSLNGKHVVMDGLSSRILTSQSYQPTPGENKLLFQVTLAPSESRSYQVLDATDVPSAPSPIQKTFARYVPERFDDFAWESDRIAHRIYGQALMTSKEHTVSSGVDVWIKKHRILTVDTMYKSGHYHEDNGESMDDYRVGKSRGCGGIGIWDGKQLLASQNWHNWKLITCGPIRSEFEVTYDPWDAGNGRKVSETKRMSIDAGSWFTKASSTFSSEDKSPLTIGIGLAERSSGPDGNPIIRKDRAEGWMTYWQPEDKPKGITATAIVLAKGSVKEFTTDLQDLPEAKLHEVVPQPTHEGAPALRNLLAISQAEIGKPYSYYLGACWDQSGDFTNNVQWDNQTQRVAERRDQPLQVSVMKP